ncbi:MAG: DUF456 domain-containing protein [Anaerolineae bacterium]|nr:DUF456 domain-containing protein [Anaerolineae bacterium]
MQVLLQSLGFGIAVAFIVLGLIGTIVPAIPGPFLIWFTMLIYAWLDGFEAITPATMIVLTVIFLVIASADIWMAMLGAKVVGTSRRAMVYGIIGGIIGFFSPLNLIGAILGYALGVLLGQYQIHRDWRVAIKASLGGLAGIGVSAMVQLGGGIMMLIIFAWQVLTS